MQNDKWAVNLANIEKGIFRTMNGIADEFIVIGRVIKAGFQCSRVDVTNAKYDAIVDLGGKQKLLRIQIKGTTKGSISFEGGIRSGKQINRNVPKRKHKYTQKDCDLIIGIDGLNGECYIIPILDITDWGSTRKLLKLQKYKENWQILIDIAKEKLE